MAVAYLINLVVFPIFVYPLRKQIVKHPTLFKWLILYWFSDDSEDWLDDENKNFINNWYGVYEIYNNDFEKFYTLNWFEKFLLAMKWNYRNPTWSFQVLFKPKDGDKYEIRELKHEGDASILQWRNKTTFGKQFVTYKIEGTRYFRYSYTKRFDFLGKDYINVMLGASTNRYILKLRIFNQI